MQRSRSNAADHVHYTSGLLGTLKWMRYWTASRSENARRALLRRWRSHLRPALSEQTNAVKARAEATLRRSAGTGTSHSYDSLADAVRQRQLMDVHG